MQPDSTDRTATGKQAHHELVVTLATLLEEPEEG